MKVAEICKGGCKDGDVRERNRDCVLATAGEVCGWMKRKCRYGVLVRRGGGMKA